MKLSRWLWLLVLVCGILIGPFRRSVSVIRAQNQSLDQTCLVPEAQVSRRKETGIVRFIGTDAGRPVRHPRPQQAQASPEAAARAYFASCGSLFGIQDQTVDLRLTRTDVDSGRTVVRFQQLRSGIPIIGGELIVHLDRARDIVSIVAETIPGATVNTVPTVDAVAAAQVALDQVAHELTHAVTQYTSSLFNYYQSGAINESLSDVFGEFVDLTNGHGNDAPSVRWWIGEDVTWAQELTLEAVVPLSATLSAITVAPE